jgi:alcohol dehydrogenase class IV
MERIIIHQPGKIVFGEGSFDQFIIDLTGSGLKRLFVLAAPFLKNQIDEKLAKLVDSGITCYINSGLNSEPGFRNYYQLLEEARVFNPDGVIGIGGGSVMDVAKLLAVMTRNTQKIDEVVGISLVKKRDLYLACFPTTSGTGSEVSPNAILFDEEDGMKKAIISPYLIPDAAYIDPFMTTGMPSGITASTGMDALTHCIEAYTNRFAHPIVDLYALEGIRLIGGRLVRACADDLKARTNLSLGSLYGGMCLGPVNTAGVHALSYPLGSRFKIAHGLANAILLPCVMEYNLSADAERYQNVALALGAEQEATAEETAYEGVVVVRRLMKQCKIPEKLSEIGIPRNAISEMAMTAIKIQRLMKNNVREISEQDAVDIYQKAF